MKITIPPFSRARVLVVGDVMLDRYWHGATARISPEAPVPVVHIGRREDRPGGAANVAVNLAALGVGATVLGLTGRDEAAAVLHGRLEAAGVRSELEPQADGCTTVKLRILSSNQQLIRLDFEEAPPQGRSERLLARFRELLPEHDLVVLSDYAKGALRPAAPLIEAARAAGLPVVVDPKGTDFSIYRGASLITPNLAELEAAAGPCTGEADLVAAGTGLVDGLGLDALLVTRSEKGMTLFRRGEAPLHLPTHAREVYDVTGAGDTVIATLAGAMAAGLGVDAATALANLAAGIVVGKLGTAAVSEPELREAAGGAGEADSGVLDEERLVRVVEEARCRGERIVMTNGCFDLLHAGHVDYLRAARALGDRLVVAVNDDESVRRLKGPERPLNAVDRRMEVVAALGCVDWVVPFSEDTPERLICRLAPDVLVKGGDYRPEEIAGGECVRARGGEVVVLPFREGCSTTGLIDRIHRLRDR